MKTIVFITLFLAFSPAMAVDVDSYINSEMKREESLSQLEQEKAAIEIPTPDASEILKKQSYEQLPLSYQDPSIDHLAPTSGNENSGHLDQPQAGFNRSVDPTDEVQHQMAEQQEQDRQRNNYRKAVEREFVRRAELAGVVPDRDIAEEIRALEQRSAQ